MNALELADLLETTESTNNRAAAMLRQQQAENEALKETVDKLLNHCDDPECWECGKIICPHKCEMHFHHDGCPTCAQME